MIKILMKGEGIKVIILGGGHDLTDNLERMKMGSVRYVRVSSKGYERVVKDGK